jgi:hypothetical protein
MRSKVLAGFVTLADADITRKYRYDDEKGSWFIEVTNWYSGR